MSSNRRMTQRLSSTERRISFCTRTRAVDVPCMLTVNTLGDHFHVNDQGHALKQLSVAFEIKVRIQFMIQQRFL